MSKNRISRQGGIIISVICVLLTGAFSSQEAVCFDTIQLAQQIAKSLKQVPGRKYATVAFSRIQGGLDTETVNEIIDYTENEIVQNRRFRVIDRSKLQLILREQKFNLTGMVSSDTYKQLGKLLGVDLFIYGRYYTDTIVLKAIDVESSAIVWGDIFQLGTLSSQTATIKKLAVKTTAAIKSDLDRLKANRINQISFWSIKSDLNSDKVIDYLSIALTKDGNFQVVDRENLQLILEEQKLNMEDFIDEQKAKKMGELYGVDAFIYGRLTMRKGQYIASLKMLNIYNGVIEWAGTIRFDNQTAKKGTYTKRGIRKSGGDMVFIPAGVFTMGSDKGKEISFPAFSVPVKAFYIDRTEISNRDYYTFVKKFKHRSPRSWPGGKISPGKENYPVVMVSWKDASRYCGVYGKRLPKEVEWEKAARGTTKRKYPWKGDKFYAGYARTIETGVLTPEGVNSNTRDISYYSVKHMAGNVREWVNSYLRPYPGSRYHSGKVGRERVIRGGSWAKSATHSISWHRDSSNPVYGWKDVGFRCARPAK